MNGDDEHDAPGDDPRVDELAEALLPLAVALAEEPSPAEEEDRPS